MSKAEKLEIDLAETAIRELDKAYPELRVI